MVSRRAFRRPVAFLPRGTRWHEGNPRRHPPVSPLGSVAPPIRRRGRGTAQVRTGLPARRSGRCAQGHHPRTTPRPRSPSSYTTRARRPPSTPHSFCARLDVSAGDELNTTLTLTNEDDHPFAIEAALHTYLHVGDVKDVTVEGLDGERYYDKVRERYATQSGDITYTGPTDRVYTSTAQVQGVDPNRRGRERLGFNDRVESLVTGYCHHERHR